MRKHLAVLLFVVAQTLRAGEIPITEKPEIVGLGGILEGFATDGTTFLIINGSYVFGGGYDHIVFRGTIIGANGQLLTPMGFALGEGESAAVASSGNGYLVVITRAGGASGIRMTSRGEVLDANPFLIAPGSSGPPGPRPISVAWDGRRYVVSWPAFQWFPEREQHLEQWLAYAFVREDGLVEHTGRAEPDVDNGTVAARNGLSLLVWRTGSAIFARALRQQAIGDPFLVSYTSRRVGSLSIAAADDGFLAVWNDRGVIVARSFDTAGQPIASPFVLPIVNAGSVTVTWDGTSYLVIWSEGTAVRAMRIGSSGSFGRAFDVATGPEFNNYAAAVSTKGRTAVAFGGIVLSIKWIDTTDAVTPPPATPGIYAFPAIASQSNVRADFNGVDYVVIWESRSEVRFSRITRDGRRLDGDGIVIARGSVKLLDAVAGSGPTLILWREDGPNGTSAVRAVRFDPSGAILDTRPLQLTTDPCGRSARALWDGSQFVAFWSCGFTSMDRSGTQAARISGSGTIVDTPHQVFPYALLTFDVAWNGDRFQLAYNFGPSLDDLAVVNISKDLRLVTASHKLNLATEKIRSFSIASDGDDFAVVWNNDSDQVVGQRTNWDAQAIGPRVVYSETANKKGKPQVRWDGATYTVVWPEVLDSRTFGFVMRHVGRIAENVGPASVVAQAPIIETAYPTFLTDWVYVPALPRAVVYGRPDVVAGLTWFERLFLQEIQALRRRATAN
jgi:hypothetical protein